MISKRISIEFSLKNSQVKKDLLYTDLGYFAYLL